MESKIVVKSGVINGIFNTKSKAEIGERIRQLQREIDELKIEYDSISMSESASINQNDPLRQPSPILQ